MSWIIFRGFRIRENMWWTRYRPTAVTIHQFVSILFHGICHMEHKVRVIKLELWRFNLHILPKVHLYHFFYIFHVLWTGHTVQWKSWNFLHHSYRYHHCKNEPCAKCAEWNTTTVIWSVRAKCAMYYTHFQE